MHRTAQAEHMEVQKRGNHGTLSAQLHNEKSNPLVVSILHVMFMGPVAEPPQLRSERLSLARMQDSPAGTVSHKKTSPDTKQLINIIRKPIQSMEKKQDHYVS